MHGVRARGCCRVQCLLWESCAPTSRPFVAALQIAIECCPVDCIHWVGERHLAHTKPNACRSCHRDWKCQRLPRRVAGGWGGAGAGALAGCTRFTIASCGNCNCHMHEQCRSHAAPAPLPPPLLLLHGTSTACTLLATTHAARTPPGHPASVVAAGDCAVLHGTHRGVGHAALWPLGRQRVPGRWWCSGRCSAVAYVQIVQWQVLLAAGPWQCVAAGFGPESHKAGWQYAAGVCSRLRMIAVDGAAAAGAYWQLACWTVTKRGPRAGCACFAGCNARVWPTCTRTSPTCMAVRVTAPVPTRRRRRTRRGSGGRHPSSSRLPRRRMRPAAPPPAGAWRWTGTSSRPPPSSTRRTPRSAQRPWCAGGGASGAAHGLRGRGRAACCGHGACGRGGRGCRRRE